jgi:Tol biopolymer transport system component
VVLHENFVNRKVLLQYGTRSRQDEINPNYPILAWDGKGTRLAVIYSEEGKVKLFVYDALNRVKITKQEITEFDQVQDMKYMLDANTLILSAVKSGQTDIYVYKIDKQTSEQITNDVYDDLDASFVAFPNKTGIIFSSNRPSANAPTSDTSFPSEHYNIFLVDNWNKSEFKQVSQLTNVKFGDARFPSQYNTSHL